LFFEALSENILRNDKVKVLGQVSVDAEVKVLRKRQN
jgi:hypothetical protein